MRRRCGEEAQRRYADGVYINVDKNGENFAGCAADVLLFDVPVVFLHFFQRVFFYITFNGIFTVSAFYGGSIY
jgi:hypothetical protein